MSASSKVNFIHHLLAISQKFVADSRLSPWHISLYYALFHSWNQVKFSNPFSISRSELMLASKIGSANTYTRCLKELDAWGYLKYNPSYNPHLGSIVYMYTFDKSTDKGGSKGSVIAVIPYIKSINNTNIINKRKRENNLSLTFKPSNEKSKKKIQVATKTSIPKKRKKVAEKKVEFPGAAGNEIPVRSSRNLKAATSGKDFTTPTARRQRPLLQQVQLYFKEKAWPEMEAEKYFNHYQSNGWLVGGKTPMSDWQASAAKWMLNVTNFQISSVSMSGVEEGGRSPSQKQSLNPGSLNTPNTKNYNEPL
jgi:hypothetical protein